MGVSRKETSCGLADLSDTPDHTKLDECCSSVTSLDRSDVCSGSDLTLIPESALKNGPTIEQPRNQRQRRNQKPFSLSNRTASLLSGKSREHRLDPKLVEWQACWRRLKVSATNLDKDCQRELNAPRLLDGDQLKDLRSEIQRSNDSVSRWEKDLWSGIAKGRRRIHALSSALPIVRNAAEVKTLVTQSERDLAILKEQQIQEDAQLMMEESALTETLNGLMTRFDAWVTDLPAQSCAQNRARSAGSSCHPERGGRCSQRPNAVPERGRYQSEADRMFEEERAEGGSYGGWPKDDHETFMRLLRRRPHREPDVAFLLEVQQLLPHRHHAEFIEHAAWLQRHEERRSKQKKLVQGWREGKSRALSVPVPPAMERTDGARLLSDEAQEAKTEMRKRQEAWQRGANARREQQLIVAQWQKERKMQVEAERAQKEADQQMQETRQVAETRERQRRQREAVEIFRQEREAQQAAERDAMLKKAEPISLGSKLRIADRTATLVQRVVREKAARSKLDAKISLKPLKEIKVHRTPSPAGYGHVRSRVYEDAEEKSAKCLTNTMSLLECRDDSRFSAVHGNWAHQAVVRSTRALPSWRPQYGA